MSEQNINILRNLDRPLRIAVFTTDDLLALIAPFAIGCIFGFLFTGIFLSAVSYIGLKYLKSHVGEGSLLHAMYWYLPGLHRNLKVKIKSNIREYIG